MHHICTREARIVSQQQPVCWSIYYSKIASYVNINNVAILSKMVAKEEEGNWYVPDNVILMVLCPAIVVTHK